jgi:hypothetical protein
MPRSAVVLLVTPHGGHIREERHDPRQNDIQWLIDDALAPVHAAKPQLNEAGSPEESTRWSIGTLRRVHDLIRRSDVVHLEDDSSFAAAIFTLCAWLYRRPTIVGPSANPATRPTLRRWHRRVFMRCLGGSILRFATRVVVPDEESRNRALAKDVEPSRIALIDPTADVGAFYQGLYGEIALPQRSEAPSRQLPAKRHVRGWLSVGVIVVVLVGVALLSPIRGALREQMALSFTRRVQAYSEVFLPEPLALPTKVKAGGRIAFNLGVHNQNGVTITYYYLVTESSGKGTIGVLGGYLRVASGRTSEIPLVIRARPGPELTVRVSVTPSNLSVAFHVRVVGT